MLQRFEVSTPKEAGSLLVAAVTLALCLLYKLFYIIPTIFAASPRTLDLKMREK